MKGGHNPNREQKTLLTKNKKNWTEWLLVNTEMNKTNTVYTFKHKEDDSVIQIDNHGKMLNMA